MEKDAYRYFRIEARELMDQLAAGALDLEKGGVGVDLVPRLLRLAHTLKGAARVVKQARIADLIHGVEDLLAPHRESGSAVSRALVDSLLAALDGINDTLAQLPVPQASDAVAAAPAPREASEVPNAPPRVTRADVLEVDVLLEGLGEIGSELAGMRRTGAAMERLRDVAAQVVEGLASGDVSTRALADDLHGVLGAAERNLAASIERIDRELRQARDAAERLRLVPVASIFNTLERTARDAAHSVGTQIVFEALGGEVRIDGEVLDSVQTALVQLVRNAVAHGIEAAGARQAQGKPPAGRVTVQVIRRGYRAWFRCVDDGRGVDLAAVRAAALKAGAALADTQALDAAQLLALLFKGGISTASAVTELAGRGIGLDVVRAAVHGLNGEVIADTTPGAGTRVELRVPLSLASLDVLMVEADGQIAALPLDAVRRTLRVTAAEVVRSPEGGSIAFEGRLIPLAPLTLGARQRAGRATVLAAMTAVVVAAADETMALAVTGLKGIDTVVLRRLPALAPADPIVLGMHLDTEGNPRIVLDPDQFASLTRLDSQAQTPGPAPLPILIIDDSLTTRMLESSILESAGFVVELAASAEEGLDKAQRKRYALFLVDVEMPGMDGFGFVEHTRASPALREVPCILVTSRESQDDRRRGLAAGACAYIVKGEFDQVEFLQRVAELVQR